MQKFLNEDIQKQLKEILSQAKQNIKLILFLKEGACPTCAETKQLLEEVSALSTKIELEIKDITKDHELAKSYNVTLTPSFVILDEQNNYKGVKFNGIPAGHEINSFITALLEMSGLEIQFQDQVLTRIKAIKKPVNIKVFITLGCPHCPGAVQNAHRLAMLSEYVEGEMIEAQTFAQLSNQYNVSGVPKIVINEQHELVGNQPIEAFLNIIDQL
jgi:glutaredoxin-like protein